MKLTLLISFLTSVLPHNNAYSSCIACSESFGIIVELKSGKVEKGYIAWNNEEYPINKWIEAVNLGISGKGTLPEQIAHDKFLILYKKFDQILFPHKTYVAVKEETLIIPLSDISKINPEPLFSTRIDTSGLNILPLTDIAELKKKPAYVFTEETEMGGLTYFVSISTTTDPLHLLKHLFKGKHNKLSFNSESLTIDRYDFGGFNLACVGKISRYERACRKFRTDWELYQEESEQVRTCDREWNRLLGLARQTTVYQSASYVPEVRKKRIECNTLENSLDKKYGFEELSAAELRNLGVVTLEAGTD